MSPGQTLVVSVSGGCDSVALLRLLLVLQPAWRLRLHVLHFNHALRPESEEEEAFVRELAATHSLPVHVRRLPAGWQDAAGAGGVQEQSRTWRRAESIALLEDLDRSEPVLSPGAALESGSATADRSTTASNPPPDFRLDDVRRGESLIALGHHADDQVETMLLKALRGCHLSNLRGMSWCANRFARPMLELRKHEIEAYLNELGQPWREDASNLVPKYKRNRVRLQLLPLLEELSGGALLARLQAAEEQSAQLREWLDQAQRTHLAADPVWSRGGQRALSVGPLLSSPAMLQDELLHALVRESTRSHMTLPRDVLRRVHAQLARASNEWAVELGDGWTLRRTGDAVSISGGKEEVAELMDSGVRVHYPAGWAVEIGSSSLNGVSAAAPAGALALDVRSVRELTLRAWREGDLFHPRERHAPLALSHVLRGLGMSLDERRRTPLLCRSNSSEVLAVYEPRLVGRDFQAPMGGEPRELFWVRLGAGHV